jgi:hypothetical protein
LRIWRFTKSIYITNIFFCSYYNTENKMKIAVKPDKDLPVGPLGPVAFTIPKVLGISPILQKQSGQNALA